LTNKRLFPYNLGMIKERKQLRVPLPIKIDIKRENINLAETVQLGDISWGGAFLCMENLLPARARVMMEFDIPDLPVTLGVWGTVVRVHNGDAELPKGVGVQFDELDSEGRAQIQILITRCISTVFKKSR